MTYASANSISTGTIVQASTTLSLICPVSSFATLKAAVDNGADWVRVEYCNATDPIDSTEFNYKSESLGAGIRYAHDKKRKVLLALEGRSNPTNWQSLCGQINHAAQLEIDAIVLSDPALMLYTIAHYPDLQIHYSVNNREISAGTANLLKKQYGISRIVLPRAISLVQIQQLANKTSVELEVNGSGLLYGSEKKDKCCPEPLPTLNTANIYRVHSGATLLNQASGAPTAFPLTSCATGENPANDDTYLEEYPVHSPTLKLLPQLAKLGIHAVKIDVTTQNPDQLAQTIKIWHEAIKTCFKV